MYCAPRSVIDRNLCVVYYEDASVVGANVDAANYRSLLGFEVVKEWTILEHERVKCNRSRREEGMRQGQVAVADGKNFKGRRETWDMNKEGQLEVNTCS